MTPPHGFGRYQIVGRIGAGGMGEVFLARQVGAGGFEKLVVIKRLLRHLEQERESTRQFLNEARVAALLNHPNVAQIYELGEHASMPFIVMEYVHGRSLRSILKALGTPLSVGASVHLARQVFSGLDYVHSVKRDGEPLNLVHRDITPENVLVTFEGVVKIIDFGIARGSIVESLTRPNTIKGKIAYLPPELLNGEPPNPGVDMYAAALLLCEGLLGFNPFRGVSESDTLGKVLQGAPVRLHELRTDVPAALSSVIERALAKDPAQRATADEVVKALDACRSESAEREVRDLMRELFPEAAQDPTAGLHTALTTPFTVGAELPTSPLRGRRTRRAAIVALGVALVLGGLGLALRPSTSPVNMLPVSAPAAEPLAAELSPVADAGAGEPASPPPPRVVEEAPKPQPARRRTGQILLYVKPWAEVFWRGRRLALTPLDRPVELPAGRQELTLKNATLGIEKRVIVDVQAGRTVTRKVNLTE